MITAGSVSLENLQQIHGQQVKLLSPLKLTRLLLLLRATITVTGMSYKNNVHFLLSHESFVCVCVCV